MEEKLTLNKETVDILVANIIPTTKYFETRFDFMQHQIDEIKKDIHEFKIDVDRRFEEVDRRFDEVYRRFDEVDERLRQIDKRFEQVDKRFEQIEERFKEVDRRFEKIEAKLTDIMIAIQKQESTLKDYIIDRDRYYDSKFAQLRNFNIAIIALVSGIILKLMGVFDFLK